MLFHSRTRIFVFPMDEIIVSGQNLMQLALVYSEVLRTVKTLVFHLGSTSGKKMDLVVIVVAVAVVVIVVVVNSLLCFI